jgi:hypothetical protein
MLPLCMLQRVLSIDSLKLPDLQMLDRQVLRLYIETYMKRLKFYSDADLAEIPFKIDEKDMADLADLNTGKSLEEVFYVHFKGNGRVNQTRRQWKDCDKSVRGTSCRNCMGRISYR